ncbi:MAG: transglycosylase SLT domain-containing protein [Bryobacteraceae bacterium]
MAPPILATADGQQRRFTDPFRIGRAEDCGLRIQNEYVSRYQAHVLYENGTWLIRDLGSANGIYVGGSKIPEAIVNGSLTFRLGIQGPEVHLQVEAKKLEDTAVYAQRYFEEDKPGEAVGDHTRIVRRAFQQVQTRQKRKYRGALFALLLVTAAIGGFAVYQGLEMRKQMGRAEDLFYVMKSLDVDIAGVEKLVRESQSGQGAQEVVKYRARRKEMEKSYDHFLTGLRVYDPKMTEEQRLILRMARLFGECELAIPPGFLAEVQNYIRKWQSSLRLKSALETAHRKGYTRRIADELLAQDLPPQFFYLALQESNFDAYAIGPPTRMGIAKGMWQFIPETGAKYGLTMGPFAELRRPDTADDRHNWEKATHAAALYLKDIYSTDAQASGLSVMASYNWGEDRVIRQIRSMPANPRERNFWRLLTDHRNKLPDETYDYVFHIFSAAVIGENPKLFGFSFDNPLAHLETQ